MDDDRTDIARSLVARVRAGLAPGIDYVIVGVGSGNPVSEALLRQFRPRVYRSDLFVASWPDGHAIAETLAPGVPHPEVALL